MRIVDRKTFLSLPSGTIYAKWGDASGDPTHFYQGEVSMKGDTLCNDFVDQPFFADPEGVTDSSTLFEAWDRAVSGEETPPMTIGDCGCRDGLYDEKQRFAVYSRVEVERLAELIKIALDTGYAPC